MKTKATIDKITVTIGAKKIELTLEEARELKKVLNETLEPVVTFPPVFVPYSQPAYPLPWPVGPTCEPVEVQWQRPVEITCSMQN